jgi:hypothetical protein
MSKRLLLVVAALTAVACSGDKEPKKGPPLEPAPVAKATEPAPTEADAAAVGTSGRHRAQEGSDWVPAEFKKGRGKWKDAGVYLDGKPLGFLFYGELPRSLEPVYPKGEEGNPMQQRFRFYEYFKALGVPMNRIKEVHIYNGNMNVLAVKGSTLSKFRKDFHFKFGKGTKGRALLLIARGMPRNTMFDKVAGIAIYIDKRPPKIEDDRPELLEGQDKFDIPYHGPPLRGGVRVYRDDRLVLHLKRNKLEESQDLATWSDDKTELRFPLYAFLEKHGVKTSDIVLADVIRQDKREERYSKAELKDMYFTAKAQAGGKILLGKDKVEVKALALYTRQVPAKTAHYIENR